MSVVLHEEFPHSWTAKVLPGPPMIAPTRQFVYPQNVPGEEDALQRGALFIEIKPANGSTFLITAALGFRDPGMPSALYSCPRADDLLILSGGYAYLVNTLHPEKCEHLPLRPVTAVLPVLDEGVILLSGHRTVLAVDADGVRWQSERVSWEGIQFERVAGGKLYGTGWSMPNDRDVPFTIDLLTGEHEGGGFTR